MTWWRAEVRSDGSVASLVEVGAEEGSSKAVRYFVAANRSEAEETARKLAAEYAAKYLALREASRLQQRDYRENHVRRGLCTLCTEPALPGKRCCQKHVNMHNAADKRRRDRVDGKPSPKVSPEQKSASIRDAWQDRISRVRRDALVDALDFAEKAGSVADIVGWLRGEISRIGDELQRKALPGRAEVAEAIRCKKCGKAIPGERVLSSGPLPSYCSDLCQHRAQKARDRARAAEGAS